MPSSRLVVAGLLVAFASLVGCSSGPEGKETEDVAVHESELKLSGTRYLGKIKSGETRTGYYYNPPRYRSFGFQAKGGDTITAHVSSPYGDGMGWITDSSYNVLAYNDDASPATLDAKVVYTVPADRPLRSYRIVFRDYDLLDATFTVSLDIASPVTCEYDGKTYQEGDSFKSTDGCNDCFCGEGGVACTKRACVCNPANEPWRNYLGNPQTCMTIRYTCAPGKRPFQNACGCGCEDAN